MPTKRRLGLDLGTNSIGWCLLDLNERGEPVSIFRCGARIFNDGRDPKSLVSLKADRREARSASRRRDRFLRRQKRLINECVRCGLMPEDPSERKALSFKDPYPIRKKALDQQLPPYEMGRALFHINQRRGFKSNRKSATNEAGVVKQSIEELETNLMKKNARTLGEFLADRHENKETVRARRLGSKTSDLYEFYPNRTMLEDEFDKIWDKQASFNSALYNAELEKKLKDTIFFQRKLKPQEVGKCTFLPEENRISKALPSFQRFRIYQELANLCWFDRKGEAQPIINTPALRDRFFDELERKNKLTFKAMQKTLKKEGIVDYEVTFNLESDTKNHLIGNMTSSVMRNAKKMMGDAWDKLGFDQQDALILLLQDDFKSDEEAATELKSSYGLTDETVENLLDASLPAGHGALSKKAIDKILPIMRDQGLNYYKAVKKAGFGAANLYDPDASLQDKLDYYGKALSGHVLNASGKPEESDEKRYGIITNPTVHIALNQIRAILNELTRLHGKPYEIALEIGRDLPMGVKGKNELKTFQQDNNARNERIKKELSELGVTDNRKNRQKYQLWEQLSPDPTRRCCPFTGEMISLADLFTEKIEIEHLLPFSETLDDSMANKTVCTRKANREKGKRSPHDAFGDSSTDYDWEAIFERSKAFPKNKQWRFLPTAMEQFEEEGGFLERHLNDTRYISRYTSQYLATIIPKNKIWVVTGRLTALLRGHWGLGGVLRGHNIEGEEAKKKNRDDHRHHTVDAITVGMTSRSVLQRVSQAAGHSEKLDLSALFDGSIDPWEGFRDEVKRHIDAVIISHRPRKKPQGSLHNETAYGLVKYREKETSIVVHRTPIESLIKLSDIEKIRDPLIRERLKETTSGKSGKEFLESVKSWCSEKGIKSLRILENRSVILIYDKNDKAYKGYVGSGNAHMDLYENPKTGKWEAEIISRFDINQKRFFLQWQKDYPTAPLIMRLRINDMLMLDEGEARSLYRIQKMSQGGVVTLAPHMEANVDARNRDPDDVFKFMKIGASSLQKRKARRVHISPTGLIQEGKIIDRKSN